MYDYFVSFVAEPIFRTRAAPLVSNATNNHLHVQVAEAIFPGPLPLSFALTGEGE